MGRDEEKVVGGLGRGFEGVGLCRVWERGRKDDEFVVRVEVMFVFVLKGE